MQYQYAPEADFSDFAAGSVIMSSSGATSFPVRLLSEIFLRGVQYLPESAPYRVYDPCCGSGYLLTVLGFLQHRLIHSLYGSDIDFRLTSLAQANLALLSPGGLATRRARIVQMWHDYGKNSHAAALQSADNLRARMPDAPMPGGCFVANALNQHLKPQSVDLLITDVPYGNLAAWQSASRDPLHDFLSAQQPLLAHPSVAVIISDKAQKPAHPDYQRLFHDTLGKRRITFLAPR